MKILKGIPVSPGVAIGRVFVLDDTTGRRVPRRSIAPGSEAAETARFDAAVADAVADLRTVYADATEQLGPDAAQIFLFHIGALSDEKLLAPIRRAISDELVSAEYAAYTVFERWSERFASAEHSEGIQTKSTDMWDLAQRVLGRLTGSRRDELSRISEPTVVTSRELTPSQTVAFDRETVLAIVTDYGGPTSHTAIVARALELPAVVGCQRMTDSARDGQIVIVDGDTGRVILDPDEQTLARYQARRERERAYRASLAEVATAPAVTADGVEIEILGNIEFPEEISSIVAHGGTGVGLYRTEFLYLTREREPTEEEHFRAYKRCIELLDGRTLTIRTVDLGADKYTQRQALVPERNPFLGLRSIRYCLQNLAMFKTQLRAILRASGLGPVKVMFPLIGSTLEFNQARLILRDAMEDLEDVGEPYDRNLEIGMMVEVPSAAIMADRFARVADFFSIGTNDLVQYTLAVDRTNERVAPLYQPVHPAVVKLIRDVARAAKRREIPVSCCGEAAAEPTFAPLLLGLGLRTLSVTGSSIPALKRLIRSVTIGQCERLAKRAIAFDSEVDAADYIRDRVRKIVPEAFEDRSMDG